MLKKRLRIFCKIYCKNSQFFNDAFDFSSLLLRLSCRAILITGNITDIFHVLDPSYKIEKKMLIRI